MKVSILILMIALVSAPAIGAFPPLPGDVESTRISSGGDLTDVYVWAENGHAYVHFTPIIGDPQWCSSYFAIIQDSKQYTFPDVTLYEEASSSESDTFTCDYVLVPFTLEYKCRVGSSPCPDMNRQFTFVILNTDLITYVNVIPRTPQLIYPTNGIWKSEGGVFAMYLQKYKAGSCVLVVTMGDQNYTAFLDSDYKDGISASNDVDNQGYTLSLQLTDSTHGTLTVTLPGYGEVVTGVECKFEDEK